MWRHLFLTVLQAEYRTERACELPEYLGSTLRRSAWPGTAYSELRRAACAVHRLPSARSLAAGALFDDQVMSLPLDREGRGESPLVSCTRGRR